jgi:hypothetical protein
MYKLIYQLDSGKLKQVVAMALEMFERTNIEPASIELPNGNSLMWDRERAVNFINGSISEDQFIS